MAAVRVRLAAEVRTRWRSWLALAALVGLFAGAVIAAAAGARRTETSYERFLVAHPAAPLLTFLVLAAVTVAIANLVAVFPGRAAARVSPARALRAE